MRKRKIIDMSDNVKSDADTPFEKFRQFTKKIVSVPKAEIDRREKEYKKARANKKRRSIGSVEVQSLTLIALTISCLALAGNIWQIKFRLSALEKAQRQMQRQLQPLPAMSTNHAGLSSVLSMPIQPDSPASLHVSVALTDTSQTNSCFDVHADISQFQTF
jgi:hypothetical protein